MSQSDSIIEILDELRAGRDQAAEKLWQDYFHKLVGIASQALGNSPRAMADPEDVALSAFKSFCERTKHQVGVFADLQGRDDLWRLLVCVTRRKALNAMRAAGRRPQVNLDEFQLNSLVNQAPSHGDVAEVMDETRRLLDILSREDHSLYVVAKRMLEGCSNEEIASGLGCVVRTIERKFQRICRLWNDEVQRRDHRAV